METILDILQIAVIVVYIVMVVYILWANDRLTKSLNKLTDENRRLLGDLDLGGARYIEIVKRNRELEKFKEEYDKLKSNYVETRNNCDRIYKEKYELKKANDELRAKYDELLREKEELKRKYDLLHAESATLEYVNGRIKEIAEEECPSIASLYKRVMLIREQNIKDIMERAKQYDEEHCDDWGKAFEQAAQESSEGEWEESVKKEKAKAEEETKSENESITH